MSMYGYIINKPELSKVAKKVLKLLNEYKVYDSSVNDFLNEYGDFLNRAVNMEIESPQYNGFFPTEFWQSGDLFKYTDLLDLVAIFSLLVKGAKSTDDIEDKARKEAAELRKNKPN